MHPLAGEAAVLQAANSFEGSHVRYSVRSENRSHQGGIFIFVVLFFALKGGGGTLLLLQIAGGLSFEGVPPSRGQPWFQVESG